jgi:SAM-dependent methyltransferase
MYGEPLPLEEALACPSCRAGLTHEVGSYLCPNCGTAFPILGGIPALFPPESAGAGAACQELYDHIANEYDDAIPSHVAEHYLQRRLGLIGQRALAGSAVLDVCCGTGRLASALMERGYRVAGLDASVGMLGVFRERQSVGLAVAGQAQHLPFRSESFEMVLSVAALHHIATPQIVAAALAEMWRVVRPGGTVLVWDHNPLNPYWPIIMSRVPQDSGEERLIPLDEVRRGLLAAGASHIEHRRWGFTPDFLPPTALGAWRLLERLAEATPFLRKVAAHNVVLAVKQKPGSNTVPASAGQDAHRDTYAPEQQE